jgi:hypothetical protein
MMALHAALAAATVCAPKRAHARFYAPAATTTHLAVRLHSPAEKMRLLHALVAAALFCVAAASASAKGRDYDIHGERTR